MGAALVEPAVTSLLDWELVLIRSAGGVVVMVGAERGEEVGSAEEECAAG